MIFDSQNSIINIVLENNQLEEEETLAVSGLVPERTFKIEGTRVSQEPPKVRIREFKLKDPKFEICLSIDVSLRHNSEVDAGEDIFGASLRLEHMLPGNSSESEHVARHLEFTSVGDIQSWLWSPKLQKEFCPNPDNYLLLRTIPNFGVQLDKLKKEVEEDLKKRQCLLETCL